MLGEGDEEIGEHLFFRIGGDVPASADGSQDTLLLTPARHDTDGFFMAVMRKGS